MASRKKKTLTCEEIFELVFESDDEIDCGDDPKAISDRESSDDESDDETGSDCVGNVCGTSHARLLQNL